MIRLRAIEGSDEASRVAFAVPNAGGAVRRNRAKRRLRAAIAPLLLEWPKLNLVVNLPGTASEMPFAELRAALASALGTASVHLARRAQT